MEVTEINIADAERIVKRCPLLADIERIEVLARGFSAEQKFILWQRGEPAYVLRTSSVEQCRQRELGFDLLRAHYSSGVRCSQPFYFGKDETIGLCYVLVGYILGRAASDALPELSAQSQYEIGVEAGRELLKFHRMCHPDLHFNWFDRRLAKYERKVAQDAKHGLTFKHQNEIKRYIESNIDLLRESPVRFQHDDYPSGQLDSPGREAARHNRFQSLRLGRSRRRLLQDSVVYRAGFDPFRSRPSRRVFYRWGTGALLGPLQSSCSPQHTRQSCVRPQGGDGLVAREARHDHRRS